MMTMSWPELIVLVLIAAVCGAVAKALTGGGGGLLTSIALGFIGALFGPWLAHQLRLAEPLVVRVGGRPFPIVWSIVGATVILAIVHLFTRPRSRLRI
jgi:uncharacterized membrane protein YeaQ/YmgE (transglycosylase-associated protein family)